MDFVLWKLNAISVAYPFFEATARVLVKVLAGVNAGVHVLDEVVGGLDAARSVANSAGAECRGRPRVPPEIATHLKFCRDLSMQTEVRDNGQLCKSIFP